MKRVWGIFWIIAAISGAYALWSAWKLPSESENVILLGMSKSRLAFCGGILVLILFCLVTAVISFMKQQNSLSNGKTAGVIAFILLFILVIGYIFLSPPIGKTSLERSLSERLKPAFLWAKFFILLTFLLLFIQKFPELWRFQTSSGPALVWGAVVFLLIFVCIYYALSTGVGLESSSKTFYRQGVSLLEGHLIVPLLFLYIFLPVYTVIETKLQERKILTGLTIIFCILVWAVSAWLWQTTSFEGRSYFAPALRPPNYNYYPSSDAENYDLLAQSILLGNGFRNGLTVVRPLYAAFLALLHFIFGNDYMRLTNGQIMALAFIPMLIFLIGKNLRHSAAGIIITAWIIWREIYSIQLTPLVQVSNSRLLMSDLPTMLLVALFILCVIKWYRNGREETRSLLCGGMIGTAMLLRTQCFVLIPALWLVFFLSTKSISKKWNSLLFSIIGFAIVFLPWTIWGKINPNTTVNKDVAEDQYLVSLYKSAAKETDEEKGLLQIISEHPSEILQEIASHFLNNEISSLLILPVRLSFPEQAEQLFYENNLFWYRENSRETIEKNKLLIAVYILIVSFGVITAFRKNGFGGLIPLLFHIVYNLGNAFALTSGFRFILPVDWIILLYFGMGCIGMFDFWNRLCIFNFSKPISTEITGLAPENESDESPVIILPDSENQINTDNLSVHNIQDPKPEKKSQVISLTAVFILLSVIGAILPLCEKIIPRHFAPKTSEQIKAEWMAFSDNVRSADFTEYSDEDLVFLEGRAFYPRFYKAGEGDSGGSSTAKQGMDYDRMVWMFHNDRVSVLCCPLTEEQTQTMLAAPMPDPMDVIIAGIQREDFVEVLEMRRIN